MFASVGLTLFSNRSSEQYHVDQLLKYDTIMTPPLRTSGWVAAVLVACVAATVHASPLDDYVNMPDNHYSYTILKEYRIPGEYIAYVVNMTSQQWLTCEL